MVERYEILRSVCHVLFLGARLGDCLGLQLQHALARRVRECGVVSNWWALPDEGWPWDGELKCANSGTSDGAYYSDASRIPWRVALDWLWCVVRKPSRHRVAR